MCWYMYVYAILLLLVDNCIIIPAFRFTIALLFCMFTVQGVLMCSFH